MISVLWSLLLCLPSSGPFCYGGYVVVPLKRLVGLFCHVYARARVLKISFRALKMFVMKPITIVTDQRVSWTRHHIHHFKSESNPYWLHLPFLHLLLVDHSSGARRLPCTADRPGCRKASSLPESRSHGPELRPGVFTLWRSGRSVCCLAAGLTGAEFKLNAALHPQRLNTVLDSSNFSVALLPQRPGLLGTGNPGRPPRLDIAPELCPG